MAALLDIWNELQGSGTPAPYLLLDCAGIDGGESNLPKHIFTKLECLFTGDLAEELADVGPYLGRLISYAPEVFQAVEQLLAAHVAMLVIPRPEETGEISFSALHRHFRKFNVVYDHTGKPLFFRYYDPRVLLSVLAVMSAPQLAAFFEPVETLILVDQQGEPTRCENNSGRLMARG